MSWESFVFSTWFFPVIIIIALWESVWKLIALWKSGKHQQLAWFIVIAIFNTIGILPIIYLAFFQKKPKEIEPKKKSKK